MAFFSKRTQELHRFIPEWKVRKILNNIRMPRGTSLYDNIADEIGALQKFRAENPQYTRSNIVVYTDGVDDNSKNFDSKKLKRLVQNAGVGWSLTFICRGGAVENFSKFFEVQHAGSRDKDIRVAMVSIENLHLIVFGFIILLFIDVISFLSYCLFSVIKLDESFNSWINS